MTNKYYTSLKLSKLLKEAGCKLESEYIFYKNKFIKRKKIASTPQIAKYIKTDPCSRPSYHILEDICDKYCKEFFGEEKVCEYCENDDFSEFQRFDENGNVIKICHKCYSSTKTICKYKIYTKEIFSMFQKNKPKEEIEEYIWDNCVFNKNKGKYE
jgi:hypothetical protein